MRSLIRLGWLPAGHLAAVAISTACFAVLARTVGPHPFSQFALLVFLFTVTSILADLSPAGYLLTHPWRNSRTVRAAGIVALMSGGVGAAVLVGVVGTFGGALGLRDAWVIAAALGGALLTQAFTQVPRAILIREMRYRRVASAEVTATLLAAAVAILLSLAVPSTLTLVMQLLTLCVSKWCLLHLLARRLRPAEFGVDLASSFSQVVSYGYRVLPLNVAAYLSRSLDSGILPLLVPAVDSATYARSYQVVVSPISQAQVSLGGVVLTRLATATENGGGERTSARIWSVLLYATGSVSIAISIASPVVAAVLFGPRWPDAPIFIAAMACAVMPLVAALYSSWHLQLEARYARSTAQLAIALISPSAVLLSAAWFGTYGAIVALVTSSFVVPHIYIAMHGGERRAQLLRHSQAALLSTILTGIFFVIAEIGGFWSAAW